MTVLLPGGKGPRRNRKKERDLRPVRAPRSVRKAYADELQREADILKAQTANLSDLLKTEADRARVAERLSQLADESAARMRVVAPRAAGAFVTAADKAQKQALEKNIAKALGVDFARVLDSPGVAADLDLAISWNTSLIKSIGAEHWNKVGQAVLDNFRGAPLPEGQTLTQRLQQLGGVTEKRAKFIARDQTAKLTTALNKTRQESAGIESYRWRTAKDSRVVGTPGGKYPDGSRLHGDHYDRDGKVFRWDAPPPDGHPGEPINCRCIAVPVLDIEKLKAKYA